MFAIEGLTKWIICSIINICVWQGPHGINAAPLSHDLNKECDLVSPSVVILLASDGESLSVHWRNIPDVSWNDSVVVWLEDSAEHPSNSLELHRVTEPSGSIVLNMRLEEQLWSSDPKHSLTRLPKSLNYKVRFMRINKIIYSNSLQFRNHWMQDLSKIIYELKVADLILPGVDFSGSTLSPWQALTFGARYLKIATYRDPGSGKFFTSLRDEVLSLIRCLHEVYSFVQMSREIVILEIIIEDSDEKVRQKLKDLLISLLDDQLVSRTLAPNPTLKELWSSNRRLILASSQLGNSQVIWKGIEQVAYSDIESSFLGNVQHSGGSLWSLKVDEGVDAKLFLDNFEQHLWKKINILTVAESIPYANVVEIAIKANKKKTTCPSHPLSLQHLKNLEWRARKKRLNVLTACTEGDNPIVRIWPTIKAQPQFIKGNLSFRLLQINWEIAEIQEDDMLAIFLEDPLLFKVELTKPDAPIQDALVEENPIKKVLVPIFAIKPDATEGVITSNVPFPRPPISDLSRGGCVGPWVAFLRDSVVLGARCLSSYPSWMWDNRAVLGHHPLRTLIVPGSHNSGSYQINDELDPISSWVVCQDEDVLSQLLYGIRYLDLRIGYYPNTEELLWINHDMVRWIPLTKVLNDIRTFAFVSPDPVVIDVHRTPVGFENDEAPLLLASLINKTLGEFLAPFDLGSNITLNDMWESGRNLIVSYGSYDLREEMQFLWPPIFQAWANTQVLADLKTYLDTKMKTQPKQNFWAAMGHLTPSIWDIVFNVDIGVRGMADRTSKLLIKWLRDLWRDSANIVTSDFIHTGDVVYASISLNIIKYHCNGRNLLGNGSYSVYGKDNSSAS